MIKLLSNGNTNAKTKKNEIRTFILYLSPARQNSKSINLCPKASKGCLKSCLFTSGRGVFTTVNMARTRKSNLYVEDKETFLKQLSKEVQTKINSSLKKGYKVAFRLNGTSDVDFLSMMKTRGLFDYTKAPNNVYFYDYTKIIGKALKYNKDPKYTVTFSRAEDNQRDVDVAIKNNIPVAVVFNKIPKDYNGVKVIDGDISDLVMLKNKGVILGLKAKGQALKDNTNFVVQIKNK